MVQRWCVYSRIAIGCVRRVWILTRSATESHVHHIDFGNQQTVLTRDLLELPDHVWDIPPAAVPCRWVRPGMYGDMNISPSPSPSPFISFKMTIFGNNKCKNKYEQDCKALNVHLQRPSWALTKLQYDIKRRLTKMRKHKDVTSWNLIKAWEHKTVFSIFVLSSTTSFCFCKFV